ncbi:hypothetical protein OVA06_13795 [Pseudarthrobacter sp. SL88]|uniref:DUF6984 family protein n=1 Tax=Pseudarthrobacter sp. SL88 TaxID=2994666 RepID=UPI0022757603|nr:hypothetical protein [Pseudarthrobacter sp. SL88]MCY1675767.1 hypothetical protein [Pseudarthrobacter sp. SL88]
MSPRSLLPGEVLIMRSLLDHAYEPKWKAVDFASFRVTDMNDGGMGSLSFESTKSDRRFGRTLSEGWFKDEDGYPCVVAMLLDKEDEIFELDSFKVDSSARRRLPESEAEILFDNPHMD